MSILIPSSHVKEGVFYILQMLRIHTGLRKWTKNDQFHILLEKMNPLGTDRPFLKIASNKLLFEIYRISLKQDKDAIDIDGDDAMNSHRLVFDFMLRMIDHINQIYEMEKSLLIDAILKYHLSKESDEENSSEPSPSLSLLKLYFKIASIRRLFSISYN